MNVTALDAKLFVGVPYKKHGRDMGGLDCWGLVRLWHRRVLGNWEFPDFAEDYKDPENKFDAHAAVQKNIGRFRKCECKENAIALFRVSGLGSHVGVVMKNKRDFLHVLRGRHATIEALDGLTWAHRLEGFYELN